MPFLTCHFIASAPELSAHLPTPLPCQSAGGRKRKAGKLQKQLPWDAQGGSDSDDAIPAADSSTAAAEALAAEDAVAADQAAAAGELSPANGPTLADFAAAEAARAAAAAGGISTPTSYGGSPSRLLPPGTAGSMDEDEGSSAYPLSPGGWTGRSWAAGLEMLVCNYRFSLEWLLRAVGWLCCVCYPWLLPVCICCHCCVLTTLLLCIHCPPCRPAGIAAGHPSCRRRPQRRLLLRLRCRDAFQPGLERG